MTAIRHAPVLHLRFDEGSGTIASDSSGMGNHGTLMGSPLPSWVTGKYGKALSFPNLASSYVSVPNNASLQITGDLTIAFWVNFNAMSNQALVYKHWGHEYATYLQANGVVTFAMGSSPQEEKTVLVAGSIANTGQWYHIVITRDATGKVLKGYLNGVLGLSPTYTATITSGTSPVLIGSEDELYNPLNGLIDEVQIFNRALSPFEIMGLYTQAPPKWIIQYFDGAEWVEIPAVKFDGSNEELNGHEEATFIILNTAANRALVLNDYPVRFYYNYGLVFSGILKAVGYSMTQLAVTCYNQIYETLQKRAFTGSYNATAANTVLGAITGTGGAGTQNFGTLIIEPYTQHVGPEAKDAVKIQMLNVSGGSLTDIYAAIQVATDYGWSSAHVKMAVYSDVAGAPSALLGVSNEITLTATTPTWTQFHFSAAISMTANAWYWFAIINDSDIYFSFAGWTYTGAYDFNYSNVYSSGFSDPFGSVNYTYASGVSFSCYGVLSIPTAGGGVCPVTPVTVAYNNTNSYDAAAGLAKMLNKDYWGDTYFNIGVRNSCVLCIPFEDGGGYVATDVSGNGNNGAIYPVGSNFTEGRTDTGSEDYSCSANYKYGSRFQFGSGFLSKITAYVKRSSSGMMRCAIYADSSGSPGALIAQTLEATVGTSYAWVDFPFYGLSQPGTTNTLYYWLVISSAAAFTMRDQSGAGRTVKYNADTYSDGYANPFGSPSTTTSKELSIYASVYTPLPNWVAGRYGLALSFNAAVQTLVQVPNNASINASPNITMAAWVYRSAAFTDYSHIIDKYVNYGMMANASGSLYSSYSDISAGWQITYPSTPYIIPQNTWVHLAITFTANGTSTDTNFYVNGVQQGLTVTTTGHPTASTDTLAIGGGLTANFWTGLIDEVMIYNRALSAAEIAYLYNMKPYGSGSNTGNAVKILRRIDRSKVRSQITVQSVDLSGNKVSGSAGTGADIQVLTQTDPADQATLNALAASLLTQLSQSGTGSALNFPISVGAYWHPGDTVPIRIPQLAMSDNYRIQKIQKKNTYVQVAFERSLSILESILKQVKDTNMQQIANRAGVTFTSGLSSASPSLPKAGDIWWQTDTVLYFYYDGSNWVQYSHP